MRCVINLCARPERKGDKMLKTITVGSSVSVQGLYVRDLDNGRIMVNVDGKNYAGKPANKAS